MKTTLLIISLLFVVSNAVAYKFDDYFDVKYLSTIYTGTYIPDENHVFIYGYIGGIIMSGDRGTTWTKCPIGYDFTWPQSIASKENTIISVGSGGIINSIDKGKHWSKPDTTTKRGLNSVVLFDSQTGCAFGASGAIIKTTDGGKSWGMLNSFTNDNIRNALLTKTGRVIAVTHMGKLFVTDDECDSWTQKLPGGVDSLNTIRLSYSLDNNVYLLTDYKLFKSTNDGDSWTELTRPDSKYNYCYYTRDGKGFYVGDRINILNIENDMITKSITNLKSTLFPAVLTYLTCVSFFDDSTGIAAGNNNTIYKTSDGGASWHIISHLNDYYPNIYSNMQFLNDSVGIISGYLENLFKTTDYGATWKQIKGNNNDTTWSSIYGMYFFNENKGIMTSNNWTGVVLTTEDGGINIKRDTLYKELQRDDPFIEHIFDDEFILCNNKIFPSSYRGFVEIKNFYGSFRNEQLIDSVLLSDRNYSIGKLFLTGSKLDSCYLPEKPIVFERGIILISLDTGKTWSRQYFDSVDKINGIRFINEKEGYSFGYKYFKDTTRARYYTYKTNDDGESWAFYDSTKILQQQLKGMFFMNDGIGFSFVGDDIYRTQDSGNHWEWYNGVDYYYPLWQSISNNYIYTFGKTGGLPAVVVYKYKGGTTDVKETESQIETAPLLAWVYEPYPNPATRCINFKIVWIKRHEYRDLQIKIYDIFGREIINPILDFTADSENSGTVHWYPGNIEKGIYIFQLKIEDYQKSRKVIVY